MRSETLGSVGISSPPRSKIEIDGVDYNKNLDGYNIAVVDIRTGIVESSSNFRIDIDPNAGRQLIDFLDRVQGITQFVCNISLFRYFSIYLEGYLRSGVIL